MGGRYPGEHTAPATTHRNGGTVAQLEDDSAIAASGRGDAFYRHDVRAMHAHEMLARERRFELVEGCAHEVSPAAGEDSSVHVIGGDELDGRDRNDHLAITDARNEAV